MKNMFAIAHKDSIFLKKIRAVIVPGEYVTIEDFEEFKFFVHPVAKGDEHRGKFAVSELTTGHAIAFGFTKNAAIDNARFLLTRKGVYDTRKHINKVKSQYSRITNRTSE